MSRFTRKIPVEANDETSENMQHTVEYRNGDWEDGNHDIFSSNSCEMNSLKICGGVEQQYNIIMEDPKEYENSKC
jgi:hypothetical protein